MLWRTPKKSYFDYFEDHANEIEKGAYLLKQLFSDQSSVESVYKQIRKVEHQADDIIRAVITQLNTSSFILPLDHEDILNLTKALDDVVDDIDDSSESFFDIYCLTEATPEAKHFAHMIVEAAEVLNKACHFLRKPAQHADQILSHCRRIHEIEHDGDDLKKDSLKRLFADLKAGRVEITHYLAWNQIYQTLEEVTDKIDDCANIAEQIVTKYS